MQLQAILGFVIIPTIAWLLSEARQNIQWRIVVGGIALQLLLTVVFLKLPILKDFFLILNSIIGTLQQATNAGTSFVFGYIGGGPLPFEEKQPGSSFILAFRALPLILVMSALSALLFYWRILPWLVKVFSWLLKKSLGVGGALGLSGAANIFVGMVEAPILIRPYIGQLSRGELFALMTTGMATIAGTMMALYAAILGPHLPDALGHILIASVVSVPAAIALAGLMVPTTNQATDAQLTSEESASSAMDAITTGTTSGVQLFINVTAMLVVLVALVALLNLGFDLLPAIDGEAITLQRMAGWILAPLAWLIGIPWSEANIAGGLLGTKVVLNEFIAYLDLAALPAKALSEHSRLILVYAMCGFANLGSLGIMLGGLGTLAPERRSEITALGMKSILAGLLATCLTGAAVGLIA
ncbi:NupC/NupG family nucleoside CNT transporter [Pseudomonadota bacterium]